MDNTGMVILYAILVFLPMSLLLVLSLSDNTNYCVNQWLEAKIAQTIGRISKEKESKCSEYWQIVRTWTFAIGVFILAPIGFFILGVWQICAGNEAGLIIVFASISSAIRLWLLLIEGWQKYQNEKPK